MATIEQILQVEVIETDIYRGPSIASYLQRTFGGQVAGQARGEWSAGYFGSIHDRDRCRTDPAGNADLLVPL